jgi:hypothetical protein
MKDLVKTAPCSSCKGDAGCHCGSAACSKCADECQGGPLQRPQFFSGQLLTEDDLQLLSDYVAAKSRLHNRFLHGYGVVCGLLVMCHPCGGGKVVVQPGTALDCCGNHIIVPCPVELDINAMVQALRIELRGGYDCGDPCKEPCNETDDCKDEPLRVERKVRRYCLYIRYCEVQEEPVAPYVTGGDCAVQVCRPTRIREGYRFELRCPEKEPEPDDLWHRIRCCIGELTRADKAADDAVVADKYFAQSKAAAIQIDRGRVPTFDESDVEQLKSGIAVLTPLQELAVKRGAARAAEGPDLTELDVRKLLDAFQATASAVIRYDLQPAESEAARAALHADAEVVESARDLLGDVTDRLRAASVAKLPSARDRLIAETWISQGVHWTAEELPAEQRGSRAQLMYAFNAPTSTALQYQFSKDLSDLRDWLLERLDGKSLYSDCRLRRDVLAIDIPADSASKQDSEAAKRLAEAIIRYLIECICAALNPPCQPCEDSAVKLACLTVDDCEVVSICNLERTFVLSAPAIRYWVPFLHALGEAFERFCCDFRFKVECGRKEDEQPRAQERIFLRHQSLMTDTAPAYRYVEGEPKLTTLMRVAKIDDKTLRSAVNLGGNLVTMATTDFALYGESLRLAGGDVSARLSEAAAEAVVRKPRVREALVGDVERAIGVLRRRVEEGGADTRAVESLVEANRVSAKTIKDLEAALAKQEKRLAKLEKGG